MKKLDTRHEELLKENAFTLLRNYHIILNDPRMRYATINMVCGKTKNGTEPLVNPTLGAYIEWWTKNHRSINKAVSGEYSLCYKLIIGDHLYDAGLISISETGKNSKEPSLYIDLLWKKMKKCIDNNKQSASKLKDTVPFTFEEVIEIINKQPSHASGDLDILDYFYNEQMIHRLEEEIADLHHQVDHFKKKYHTLLMIENYDQLKEFYRGYLDFAKKIDIEKDHFHDEQTKLKAKVKNGTLTNVEYRQKVKEMKNHIDELEWDLLEYRQRELSSMFPNDSFNLIEIEKFLNLRSV